MKILVLTQAVDRNDPVLGFFHRWLTVFAAHFERITAVCLKRGLYDLPSNVSVYSLGKEEHLSRVGYVWRFYRRIWRERRNYDAVLVHMNFEYVLLGALLWFFLHKPIYLWYNHQHSHTFSRLAFILAHTIFHTSPFAAPARMKKAVQMPVGVDTDTFTPDDAVRTPRSTLFLGRLSPVKRLDVLVDAAVALAAESIDYVLSIYGDMSSPRDMHYVEEVREKSNSLEEKGTITFHGSVRYEDAPPVYRSHEIFINCTNPGSFDKTIIEAMASGTIPLISNTSVTLDDERLFFKEGDAVDLAKRWRALLELPEDEKRTVRERVRSYAVEEHSLQALAGRLLAIMSS